MAELYFKVKADYDEVLRLQYEISVLQDKIRNFDTSLGKVDVSKWESQLAAAKERMNELVEVAAAAATKLQGLDKVNFDLASPQEKLVAFNETVMAFCNNIDQYFEKIQSRLNEFRDLLSGGQSIAEGINVNEENVRMLDDMKRQNEELTAQIQKQSEELNKQREIYQQLADAVKNNTQLPQIQGGGHSAQEIRNAKKEYDELSNKIIANLDHIEKLEEKEKNITTELERQKNQAEQAGGAIPNDKTIALEKELERVRVQIEGSKNGVEGMKQKQAELSEVANSTAESHVRMRTQIMNAREELIKMVQAGQAGTPMFQQMAERAGGLRRSMMLANAAMQYYADPIRHFSAMKQAMTGLAGAASLVTGVFGLFNSKSEDMVRIQTRIQSLLGIIIGLERVYGAVKKTSTLYQALSELRAKAEARARALNIAAIQGETAATKGATIAQAAFNAVAKMNPYVLLATGAAALIGGLVALSKHLDANAEKEKKLAEEAKARAEAEKKFQEDLASIVAENAGKQLGSYERLRRKWNELGKDLKAKKQFIEENKDAFHELGWAVDSVSDAETFFVSKTQNVVAAIMARARAAAYEQMIMNEIQEEIKRQDLIRQNATYVRYSDVDKYANSLKLTKTDDGRYGIRKFENGRFVDTYYTRAQLLEKMNKQNTDRNNKAIEERDKKLQESWEASEKRQKKYAEQAAYYGEQAVKEQKALGIKTYTEPEKKDKKVTKKTNQKNTQADLEKAVEISEDLLRKLVDMEHEAEQARINTMKDGTEKRRAQAELDYKKELEQITRFGVDKKNEYVSQAAAEAKARGKKFDTKKFMESDKQYLKYVETIDKVVEGRRIAAYNKLAKFDEDLAKKQRTDMREWLKQYGDYAQRRQAIIEEYNEKIANAETEGERKMLQSQREETLQALSFEALKEELDWENMFNRLEYLSIQTLSRLKERLRDALDAKDITAENAKVISEKLQEIEKQLYLARNPILQLFNGSAVDAYINNRVRKSNEATARANANAAANEAIDSLYNYQAIQRRVQNELRGRNVFLEESDVTTENLKAFNDESEEFAKWLKELEDAENAVTDATSKNAKAQKILNDILGTSLSEKMNEIAAYADLINTNIQSGVNLIDNLNLSDTDFGQRYAQFAEGVGYVNSSFQKFAKLDVVGGLSDLIGGFGTLGDAFGLTGDSDRTLAKDIERLTLANQNLQRAIEGLTKEMSDAQTSDIKEIYQQQKEYLNESMKNVQAIMQRVADNYKSGFRGEHSGDYYINNRISSSQWARITSITGESVRNANDFFDLTSKQMSEIATKAPDIWTAIQDAAKEGYRDASEYMDEFIGYWEQLEELEDNYLEQLTGLSFDSLESSFASTLKDMDSDAQDFSNAFQDYMVSAIMDAYVNDAFENRLKDWRKKFAEYMATDGTINAAEQADLQNEWNKMAAEALAYRDNLRRSMGWQTESQRQASSGGYTTMSEDTGQELNGRFTAIQIATEAIRSNLEQMSFAGVNNLLTEMQTNAGVQTSIATQTQDILARSLLEIQFIRENTESVVRPIIEMNEKLTTISDKVRNI